VSSLKFIGVLPGVIFQSFDPLFLRGHVVLREICYLPGTKGREGKGRGIILTDLGNYPTVQSDERV
jgi:hypothetical protein